MCKSKVTLRFCMFMIALFALVFGTSREISREVQRRKERAAALVHLKSEIGLRLWLNERPKRPHDDPPPFEELEKEARFLYSEGISKFSEFKIKTMFENFRIDYSTRNNIKQSKY